MATSKLMWPLVKVSLTPLYRVSQGRVEWIVSGMSLPGAGCLGKYFPLSRGVRKHGGCNSTPRMQKSLGCKNTDCLCLQRFQPQERNEAWGVVEGRGRPAEHRKVLAWGEAPGRVRSTDKL